MKLNLGPAAAEASKVDVLAVPVFEGGSVEGMVGKPAARSIGRALSSAQFSGKEGKTLVVAAPAGVAARAVMLIGLGRRGRDTAEATRRAAGTALGKASEASMRRIAFAPPSADAAVIAAACEGFLLADYTFSKYKSANGKKDSPEKTVTVACSADAKAAVTAELPLLRSLAAGVKTARDLGNEPANVLTPIQLAEEAMAVARERKADGVKCQVLGLKEIEKLGMGAYLAVARGSVNEPRFIHLTWTPKRRTGRKVALVGKGLCFDSGGISIKPAGGMEDMKHDMCGAATVVGLFRCLPDLGVGHEVHGFIAACENMPSGSACRPGDIVKSMSGRSIEIINTDAEGRLTLVDAMQYAMQGNPDVMIDLATLTGACAVALGEASGIMSNDPALRDALWRSSDATGERAWPLPLFEDYKGQIKSEHADVKNLGDRFGGALTAGLFLQEWVPATLPWAHLDIAGSAWTGRELSYCPKGATGIGVRTLAHWLRSFGA